MDEAKLDRLVTLLEKQQSGSGWAGSDRSTTSRSPAMAMFNKGVEQTAKAMQILHGNTQQLSQTFYKMIGGGALGYAASLLVNNLSEMSKTFSKMTDIGQTFGGSLFKMQELAGDAGLSMEQFTAGITKASTVVAQMNGDQVKAVEGFNKYQTSVRNTLKLNGYYGMSLTQLNEMSAEHADTLRQTFQWEHMTEKQRENATVDFIKNVSSMAAATGKNRDALAKQTAELLKSVRASTAMAGKSTGETAAVTEVTTMLNAISPLLGKGLNQLIGEEGFRFWNTELGKAAQAVGRTDINAGIQSILNRQKAGTLTTRQAVEELKKMGVSIIGDGKRLRAQQGENRAHAETVLQLGTDLVTNIGEVEVFLQKQIEADRLRLEGTTEAINMWETTMNEITGSFRKGFYATFVEMLAPMNKDGKRDLVDLQQTILKFKQTIEDIGETVGWAFGLVVSAVSQFRNVLQGFLDWFPFLQKTETKDKEGETVIKHPAERLANAIIGIVAAIGVAYLGLRRLGLIPRMSVKANIVNIAGKAGMGDLFGGGDVDLPDKDKTKPKPGKTAADGAKPKGRMGRFLQGTKNVIKSPVSAMGGLFKGAGSAMGGLLKNPMGIVRNLFKGFSFGSLLKGIGKGFWGMLAGFIINPILDLFGNFKGKDSLKSMASYAGYGSMIGSIIPGIGTVAGAIIGGIVGLIVENFTDLTANIGGFFADMGNWAYDLVHNIVKWIKEQIKSAIPGAKRFFDDTDAKPPETKPPETKPTETKPPAPVDPLEQLIRGLRTAPPLMVVPPPPPTPPPTPPTPTPVPTDSSANDNAVVNQLANLTPAIAAETVRRVQANPTGFLPPREEETLTTLTDSVSQILAQRAIDDQRRLTESVKPIEDLNALLKEQTEVLASLLNRGNNQRDDAQRRAGNQLGS